MASAPIVILIALALGYALFGLPGTSTEDDSDPVQTSQEQDQAAAARRKREAYLVDRANHGLLDSIEAAELKELRMQDEADRLNQP